MKRRKVIGWLVVVFIAAFVGLQVAININLIAGIIITLAIILSASDKRTNPNIVSNRLFGVSLLKHEISGIDNGEAGKLLLNASREYSYRNEALKRIDDLPSEILEGLKAGKWQLNDHVLYFTYKQGTNTYVQVINDSDKKEPGLTNVNAGKLEDNEYFIMCGIRMLQGTGADLHVIGWKGIDTKTPLVNGEFTIVHGGSVYVPRASNMLFNTVDNNDILLGYYKLANPKWIKPGVKTECNVWLSAAGVDNDSIRFEIYGAMVYKA